MRDTQKAILLLIIAGIFLFVEGVNAPSQLHMVLLGGVVICICSIVLLGLLGILRAISRPVVAKSSVKKLPARKRLPQ